MEGSNALEASNVWQRMLKLPLHFVAGVVPTNCLLCLLLVYSRNVELLDIVCEQLVLGSWGRWRRWRVRVGSLGTWAKTSGLLGE